MKEDIYYYRLRMDSGNNKRNNCHHHDVTTMVVNNTDDIDDMKFIKLVQKQEILYDRKSPHFTNEQHKQHVWKEIANKFKCNAADCMAKWMLLRQRFVREKEKEIEREMKSGKLFVCADEIKSTWKYMEVMRFMEPHVTLRVPSSMAIHLPERFTAVSKQSEQKLQGHDATLEEQTQKYKPKSPTKPESKGGCRKHAVSEMSNIQQCQNEAQQQLRQQQQKTQNQVAEPEKDQQKEINILLDNKEALENSKKKSMLTSFLIAKQNRMKNVGESLKRSRKHESSKQTQYCQPLIQEDMEISNTHNNTLPIQTQSMLVSNSAPNSLNAVSIRKKSPRHDATLTQQHFTPESCYSTPQQHAQKSATMPVQYPPRVLSEQTSATQTLPLIHEEDKNVANLTTMVSKLIDIVQNVNKTQNELLDVRRSSIVNNSSCGSRHKPRFGSMSHKLNESGASIATNFPSSSFNGESFTSEELFGRLIASEISHLDSEVLVNNAKLLILKIIYKLRLGENVTIH